MKGDRNGKREKKEEQESNGKKGGEGDYEHYTTVFSYIKSEETVITACK